jgi:acetyl esterase/lipase
MNLRCLVASLLITVPVLAAGPQPEITTVPLWPAGQVPGAKGDTPDDQPFMEVYPARRRITEAALVVYPGGGYTHLALDHEGKQVAEWANSMGITAFVVHYRLLPKYPMPTPVIDAQRAIRLVRSRAKDYKINPEKVGVIGFSAGGHLVTMMSCYFTPGTEKSADAVDRLSDRPDFVVSAYPVTNFINPEKLPAMLGDDVTPERRSYISTELHVRPDSPPTFLFLTDEDRTHDVAGYYLALRQAKVPAEMHIFQSGRHGVGLAAGHPVLGGWPRLLASWLNENGWLEMPEKTKK